MSQSHWASSLYKSSNAPHSSQMPDFLSAEILCRLNLAFSSLIFMVSAIAWKSPGSIFRMSFVVINPISFFLSTTGRRRNFFFLNLFIASVMSAPGLMVVTFRLIKSFALMFSRSSLDFLTMAQMMSFSVRIPLRVSFSFMIRLPTRFFTICLAHSLRFVFGEV